MSLIKTAISLFNHYEALQPLTGYPGLLAIYALCRTAEVAQNDSLMDRCRRCILPFVRREVQFGTTFDFYSVGGTPAAYMLMKGYLPEAHNAVEAAVEQLVVNSPRYHSIFCHPRHPELGCIWIDECMALTPFLLFSGIALHREDYIAEAGKQTFLLMDELMDDKNGLLHQWKNCAGPGSISADHWGRGNGWAYLSLADLVQYLVSGSFQRDEAMQRLQALTESLLPHQSPAGLWRQEIIDVSAYEETSATGLIAYGLATGIKMGALPSGLLPELKLALQGLSSFIGVDGSIGNVCTGLSCFNAGDVATYKRHQHATDDAHGFGPAMLACCSAVDIGLTFDSGIIR